MKENNQATHNSSTILRMAIKYISKIPDLNITCDIKRSCNVLMLSQPGRKTNIAPSYAEGK